MRTRQAQRGITLIGFIFVLIIAGFALFEAALAFFQFPGTGIGFSMAIMPGLILWYMNSAEVKAAFGEPPQPAV